MTDQPPVIDLSQAAGRREAWDRPAWQVYLWSAAELLFVTNPWQPSSGLRRKVLRRFGARIDEGVILRPRLRVKFPWKLAIGARSWIGEDVWIHNQDEVVIGSDAVVSQGTFVTTGTHDFKGDMSLMTRPIHIEDGAWVTSRCIVLSGSRIRRSALVLPGTVVRGDVPEATVFGTPPGRWCGRGSRAGRPRRSRTEAAVRILHVVPLVSSDGGYGGPVSVARAQCEELARRGHRVILAAGWDGEAKMHIPGVTTRLHRAYQTVPGEGFAGLTSPDCSPMWSPCPGPPISCMCISPAIWLPCRPPGWPCVRAHVWWCKPTA